MEKKVTNPQEFLEWINNNSFKVIVWDMDCTMSAKHCGEGLPLEKLEEYVNSASKDFVSIMKEIAKIETNIKFAVATGSDPLEYNLHKEGKKTHILGPDLATKLIEKHCVESLKLFEIMIGYDCRLHENKNDPSYKGKRHQMRLIQKHYDVPFEQMLLIDDASSSFGNEDGWKGIKVEGKNGFQFSDCKNIISQNKK